MLRLAARVGLLFVAVVPGAAGAEIDRSDRSASRQPFVIGAPGRLDAAADRRWPRRFDRTDSAVAAFVDVEQVADAGWLGHEVEAYARRAVDCGGIGAAWCRREVRQIGEASAIFIAAGERAELVWISGAASAVRLAWRRVVEAPTGTMTLDEPPAEFAARVMEAWPSRLRPAGFDAAGDRDFAALEIDRLLYYVDRALAALPEQATAAERAPVERFIAVTADRLERQRRAANEIAPPLLVDDAELARRAGRVIRLSAPLAARVVALLAWRSAQTPVIAMPPVETRSWCDARLPRVLDGEGR